MTVKILLEFALGIYSKIPTELQTIFLIAIAFMANKIYRDKKKPEERCHETCSLFPEVNEMIAKAVDRCRRIVIIQEKTIVREQMNYLEVIHQAINLKMLEIFREMNPTQADIKNYKKIIFLMEHELRSIIKKWFKDNGYSKKNGDGWIAYKKDKIDLLIHKVGSELDDDFIDYSFSREELKTKHLSTLIPYAIEQYGKAFDKARDISIEYENKIKGINNEKG